MKTFFGIMMFIVIGLLTAVGFGFSWQLDNGPLVDDDEQIGLGQQTIIRFSFSVAENTPKGLAAQEFAQLVKEKTNDTIKVELFPNSTLYNETEEVAALQGGSIQMIAPSFSNISEVVPEWMAMDLPFAFQNEEAVEKAFQGKIGDILMRKLRTKGHHRSRFLGKWFSADDLKPRHACPSGRFSRFEISNSSKQGY